MILVLLIALELVTWSVPPLVNPKDPRTWPSDFDLAYNCGRTVLGGMTCRSGERKPDLKFLARYI